METNEILVDINNNLSAIQNTLWWIALWLALSHIFSDSSRNVTIKNIKDLNK